MSAILDILRLVRNGADWAIRELKTEEAKDKIQPNRDSDIKMEEYEFSVSKKIILGHASLIEITSSPDTMFRPKLASSNVPSPGFILLEDIFIANVSVMVGGGITDAFHYNVASPTPVDWPTLDTMTRFRLVGKYTGLIPPGFTPEAEFDFTFRCMGPAPIVGNVSLGV
jgi:hypothetical protein